MISDEQRDEAKRAVALGLMSACAEVSQHEDDRPETCEACGAEVPLWAELTIGQAGDEVAITVGRWLCAACWLSEHGEPVSLS